KGHGAPAFEIGFDQVNFARPDASRFQFTPPPGTTVREADQDQKQLPGKNLPAQPDKKAPAQPAGQDKTAVVGTGWTAVLGTRLPERTPPPNAATPDGKPSADAATPDLGGLGILLNKLPTVSGSWGSGRLLQAHLFSVLITDDGRILVGAVSGEQLTTA